MDNVPSVFTNSPPGFVRAAPVAAASLRPSPGSRSATRRSPPRRAPRPGAPAPAGEADPVQQVRSAAQRVPHMEQTADEHGDPGQGPALVLAPAPGGRAPGQPGAQPGQLRLAQPAHRPARPLRGQRGGAASTPAPPPHIRRARRDPQPPRHHRRLDPLGKPRRGLQPQRLTPDPHHGGQATTIGISHNPAVVPPPARVTPTLRGALTGKS